MEVKEIVVANIKDEIDNRGLKQKSVAERAGIGEQEFSQMLNFRRTIGVNDIATIAFALDITPNDLFKEDKEAINA